MSARAFSDPPAAPPPPGIAKTAAVAAALGLASALLIGWALGAWIAAAIYAGLLLAAAGIAYAIASGRARRRRPAAPDWPLLRAALAARREALAITDADDRLVCANEAYGARCGGYASPFDLESAGLLSRGAVASLAAAARRDGQAAGAIDALVNGQPRALRLGASRADGGHLIWTVRGAAEERIGDDAAALLDGALGRWLGEAGIHALMTDRNGAVLAANPRFREAAGPGDPPNLAELLTRTGAGASLTHRDGSRESVRVVEMAARIGGGEAGSYVFLLLPDTGEGVAAPAIAGDTPGLLEVLPLGLAVTDRDGRLRSVNAAFAAVAGIRDTAAVLHPSDLVSDEDKRLVSDAIRRAASRPGESRDLRVRLNHRPDEESILTIARAPGSGPAEIILSLRDNREQLKLERQVAQATKMQAVGQLAGGVAHDFNNILTAVIGYCDLMMLRHTPGDADFDDINQIRQNANRAANLVRQLLAFSRQQTLRLQLLQVPDVIGELSHLLKRLLGERIALTVRHGRNLGSVRADPGQLEQVIVNLAVNARDAMPDGGELAISTYAVPATEAGKLGYEMMPAADYVVIAVEDTGTGIDPAIIGKIFEPFFTTKEFGKGTGLGLSTVYGIVKQTGGFIFADSKGAGGSRFTIYLPVQHAAAADVADASAAAAPPAAEAWGSGTILLVEDESTVRAVAERALSRKGYEVLTAGHGEEALDILDGRPEGVDLLVTDVVMPTMDGPTLVQHARARFPDLRIIFMSGYAEEQLRRSIDVPGVAFLPKPFSVKELGEAVRAMLAREIG